MNRRSLRLRKETLARLGAGELARVGGAMPDASIGLVCPGIGCTDGPQCTAGSPCIVVCADTTGVQTILTTRPCDI